ncbi:MAG: hypothetical protein EOO16_01165 [Chitinophagaceae bacterium]|nr:MAG: hypothetical protein EOO16_01165 [Chitinophagaceae bacterium]
MLTWLLANVFVPFAVLLAEGSNAGTRVGEYLGVSFFIFAYSLLFSLPALLAGWLLFFALVRLRLPAVPLYLAWLAGIVGLIYASTDVLFAELFAGGGSTFWLPLSAAALLALLLRLPAYQRLLSASKP